MKYSQWLQPISKAPEAFFKSIIVSEKQIITKPTKMIIISKIKKWGVCHKQ